LLPLVIGPSYVIVDPSCSSSEVSDDFDSDLFLAGLVIAVFVCFAALFLCLSAFRPLVSLQLRPPVKLLGLFEKLGSITRAGC